MISKRNARHGFSVPANQPYNPHQDNLVVLDKMKKLNMKREME